jgi:ribosomal-protein-alanine N-acetyltransferase
MTICEACAFETERLSAREWHSFPPREWHEQDVPAVVVDLMTERVTQSLPEPWRGDYAIERAARWINERDSDGATLLALDRSTRQAVGLVILFESPATNRGVGIEVRLGYLLAESVWGKGLATELIKGFVEWCRAQPAIRSLIAGVERGNPASTRVLEKNAFHRVDIERDDSEAERLFELILDR